MRERFASTTVSLLDEDPRIALVLADIGVSRFAADGVMERYPDRVVNVGIREQLMISVAGGMALEGMRPIVHSYGPFLVQRPFEQIKIDLGHQDVGAVLVSIGASYDTAGEGRTHQTPGDVALLATLPGWEIDVPGHPDEVERVLRHAAAGSHRVYIRLSSSSNLRPTPIAPGRLALVKRGTAAAGVVIAVGPMLDRVMEATEGLDITVLYAVTVRPFDARTLRSEIGVPEVVLVEPYLQGTSAGVATAALEDLSHRLLSIGVPITEHRHYGTPEHHDAAHGLDARSIRERITRFLSGGRVSADDQREMAGASV